jgi:hypothetical protein
MDADCAFCGRLIGERRYVFCEDCQGTHTVCFVCADEVADGTEGVRLVA